MIPIKQTPMLNMRESGEGRERETETETETAVAHAVAVTASYKIDTLTGNISGEGISEIKKAVV